MNEPKVDKIDLNKVKSAIGEIKAAGLANVSLEGLKTKEEIVECFKKTVVELWKSGKEAELPVSVIELYNEYFAKKKADSAKAKEPKAPKAPKEPKAPKAPKEPKPPKGPKTFETIKAQIEAAKDHSAYCDKCLLEGGTVDEILLKFLDRGDRKVYNKKGDITGHIKYREDRGYIFDKKPVDAEGKVIRYQLVGYDETKIKVGKKNAAE